MQAFTRFFVDRWQFTLVLFVMLFGLGIQSVMSIPKSEDPIVSFPGVGVFVVLPGADAEQMERVIAIPIETALNGLEDVDQIRSTSQAGLASIGVSFVYGSDPEKKYDEVVRELNVIRNTLPAGITLLRANRQNPAQTNIVQMALVSEKAPYRQMEAYARELRDAMERAGGIQQAEIWGVPTSEVRITPDLDKLAAYKRVRRIEFTELPKTISGKIRRVELRRAEEAEQHEHRRAPAGGCRAGGECELHAGAAGHHRCAANAGGAGAAGGGQLGHRFQGLFRLMVVHQQFGPGHQARASASRP